MLLLFILGKGLASRIKREYPDFKIHKKPLIETIAGLLPMFVPIVNIIMILYIIFNQEKIYKKLVEQILEGII